MVDIQKRVAEIKQLADRKKTVFVSGKFNVLHPGHLRLLKFAKDSGDFLVVGVENAENEVSLIEPELRLEALKHSLLVDYSLILNDEASDFIKQLQPDVVVKGSEHENKYNPEKSVLDAYGGTLIFSSGDIQFSSLSLLKNEFDKLDANTIQKPLEYIQRHKIDTRKMIDILDSFKDLKVLVIGDTIVDEYMTCEPLGMSQEDPTIVVSPISSDVFLGGAGIVAAHAAGLGADVDFYTVLGKDTKSEYVVTKLEEYGVNGKIYQDSSRPTTLKQRFRANRKTLLRVNHLKQHHISIEIQDRIIDDIKKSINGKNLVVFSDFSYGCLPIRVINKIIEICNAEGVMMVADSQSSSQTGDISKFNSMTIVTPTEREARLGVNDFDSGLIILAEKLRKKSNIKNVFITLASEGVLIHADNNKEWFTDQIPALNTAPRDVAGAGDSLLISSSMAHAAGATMLEAAYIGSLAAASQVGRVGNIPLNISEIKKELY